MLTVLKHHQHHLVLYNFNSLTAGRLCTRGLNATPQNKKPEPHTIGQDFIGPPDKDSNLRPYVRSVTEVQSKLMLKLHERRVEVEDWNHNFWCAHNNRFNEEKQDFIRMHKISENDESYSEKLSDFYKYFLDKNRKVHMLYNLSWYLKNFDILVLSLQVNIQKLWRRIRN